MSTAARPPHSPAHQAAEGVPASFGQFLVSLGQSALVHLGEGSHPGASQSSLNLPLACHTINLLKTLRTKTNGNLDQTESKLLDALIDELSNKYDAISDN